MDKNIKKAIKVGVAAVTAVAITAAIVWGANYAFQVSQNSKFVTPLAG